jgi:hypothetical protein
MAFVIIAILGMYVGRRLGWVLSRGILYSSPPAIFVIFCVLWGCLVAYLTHLHIVWLHPHWILKCIFGFALGAYVSIPNFGLVDESTIPSHAFKRHELASAIPLWTYILLSIGFAFLL